MDDFLHAISARWDHLVFVGIGLAVMYYLGRIADDVRRTREMTEELLEHARRRGSL